MPMAIGRTKLMHKTPTSDIDSLAIHPAFQGLGYGSRLMSSIIAKAKEEGLNIALCASAGEIFDDENTSFSINPG